MQHLLTLADVKPAEIDLIFAITEDLKTKYQNGLREAILPGRVMALLFEKQSLRTRVSFEVAMINLGGGSVFLNYDDVGWGSRESLSDFGRILSQYIDVIVVRANEHQTVESLAQCSEASVINGLTNKAHPCQVLADLYTLRELLGNLRGEKLAYVGDANNVACSLAGGCAQIGMKFAIASPKEYQFTDEFLAELRETDPGLELEMTTDPVEAVEGAVAVYTDVWASMGQEAEKAKRASAFAGYQVDARLMAHAGADAVFMHCLPAHRGEEVTADVIDGPQSVVVHQASNRLHVQKGILAWLLGAHS